MTRPTLLTILCITTFIGSGFSIFNAITNYNNAEMAVGVTNEILDDLADEAEDQAESGQQANIIEEVFDSIHDSLTVENVKKMNLANGISSLLTLIGAILMWGLDKKGFWLYILGTAASIITPIVIYEGLVGYAAAAGMGLVGIIYCILYGLNLKHMS
ncbi:hypothetical protein LAG90_19630 [Marinilongibacter aquaticus]|uniref:hypothetical protein n=1 Tax=Marinilongibacter aquaticus TaxID=2975157 RepID=UPI0021BD0EAD|nr:hypothetical protein [Marinilongibacter aquaticus]UBM59014.1 hypothetical protein LAG90_19630 [Marinilongibacter aquaticus]